MPKLRKMLGKADSEYIVSLMRIIETQSKETLVIWCMDYAEKHLIPIYLKYYPNDDRPQSALSAARAWMRGEVKFQVVKDLILNACHKAAREAEEHPAAQAAARAIGQASACIHTPTHTLGIAFYGAAAIAYDKVGFNESAATYDQIAGEVCADMEKELCAIAIKDEPNPAKINWHC